MDDRLVTAARVDEDAQYEAGLRPRRLDEYIGQDRIRENLQVAIAYVGLTSAGTSMRGRSLRKSVTHADTQSRVPLAEAPTPTFQLACTASSLMPLPFSTSTL